MVKSLCGCMNAAALSEEPLTDIWNYLIVVVGNLMSGEDKYLELFFQE